MNQVQDLLNNSLVIAIIVGFLVGTIAARIMKQSFSFLGCLIVGIVGGLIGSFLLKELEGVGINVKPNTPMASLIIGIAVDVVGAMLLLKIVDIAKK